MNWEQFGIGALCVSQGAMWIANALRMRKAMAGNAAAIEILNRIDSHTFAACGQLNQLAERGTPANRTDVGLLRDEIRQALDRLPKKRNTRKPKAPPLEASSDPVGPVAS